ncbi:MAG: T9SS type A sorting domain-containing protein [Flavobacteriales bacterium]
MTQLFGQSTYFVDGQNGNNANTGLKKSDAFLTISAAINASSDGDIIRIAPGVYGEQLIVNKRLTLIGAGASTDAAVSTIIQRTTGQVITIDAGMLGDLNVALQSMRIEATSNGSAITILSSNVSLERIAARGAQQRAIQINSSVNNIIVNRAEVFDSNIGLLVNDDIDVNGVQIRNTIFRNNRTHAIMFRESNPNIAGKLENVIVSNCMFRDNNPTNINLGHAIYMEKLSNAIFENISIYTPLTNSQNAIDVNLKWRTDYSDLIFRNILISRETEGVGIFVKGRDDAPLYDAVPAILNNVSIIGSRFIGCRSNIRFENNVNGITVQRNDLSNFNSQQGFAIANLSTALSAMNADHNFFGGTPFVGLAYAASSIQGSNVITLVPPFNTEQVTPGLFVFGQNVPFATIVTEVNGNDLILSNPVGATAAEDAFMLSPNIFPSAHIVSPAISPLSFANALEFRTVNNLNQSFANLESALLGTPADGQIFHVEPTTYPGGINVDRNVTFQTAGAGSLDANSVPLFDNLIVNNADLKLNMDITVVNQLLLNGSLYLNDQQLNLEGKISGVGDILASQASSIQINGADSVGIIRFNNEGQELGQLVFNRENNGVLSLNSNLTVHHAELLAGTINTNSHTLSISNPGIQKTGDTFSLIGRLGLQIASENTTFDLLFPTAGMVNGRRDFGLSLRQNSANPNFYFATMIEESGYDLGLDLPDGIDRVSPIRYWLIEKENESNLEEAFATIYYLMGDLVKDNEPEKLNMLKQEFGGAAMWMNIGGFANPPINGSITSSIPVSELGYFSIGNVVGGNNLIPDTIYVDATLGNNNYNGLSPIFNPETNDGPKLTINAGIEAVSPTGVVSIAGAYYPERVFLNKRICLSKSGTTAVSVDTLVIMNGVRLLPNLPSETDFAINTVDLEAGARLADGFLLVAEDGVVYLREQLYSENVSTNKSFIIKGETEVTVHTINLNANNILTLETPFVVGNQINLNATSGSRVRIYDDNLTVSNLSQITGISPISYVITEGNGFLTLQSLGTESVIFPVGTSQHYAPVDMRDDNNTGDAIGARVKFAEQGENFIPVLPELATSYVQLQWHITESTPGGHSLKMGFNYNNQVQVNGFDGQPNRILAISNNAGDWTSLNSAFFTPNNASALGLTDVEGSYAMYALTTVGLQTEAGLTGKVYPNPFKKDFQVFLDAPFAGTLQLVDMTGRVIWEEKVNTMVKSILTLSSANVIPAGVYFLNMNNGAKPIVHRLIKQD